MALKFPSDLPDKYYCSISFYSYQRPDPFTSLMTLASMNSGERSGDIVLPIPANLVDNQRLNWGVGGSSIAEALTDIGQAGMGQISPEELGATVGAAGIRMLEDAAALAGLGGNVMGNIAVAGTSAATKSILQKNGLALNPVLTQQFNHPDFKTHQFSWKMSPDTPSESGTIEAIVDTIRYNSLPDVVAGGMFFKYPSIAIIKLHTGSKELYKFQPAVISDISVNYAPANTPAFMSKTAAPASVQITITFLEIILNTRKNTTRSSGQAIDLSLGQNSSNFIDRTIERANDILNNRGR